MGEFKYIKAFFETGNYYTICTGQVEGKTKWIFISEGESKQSLIWYAFSSDEGFPYGCIIYFIWFDPVFKKLFTKRIILLGFEWADPMTSTLIPQWRVITCGLYLPPISSRFTVVAYRLSLHRSSGPRLNIKTVLSTYGDFHVKDKTAVRTSYL